MNNLETKLKIIQDFQKKYPTSHIGGSIGLFIRGINLNRDLTLSDLDISIDKFEITKDNIKNISFINKTSSRSDFDLCFNWINDDKTFEIIDLCIIPELNFDKVEFNNFVYNVTPIEHTIKYKEKYANENNQKHINDLIYYKKYYENK
jgi:hypothetical protein